MDTASAGVPVAFGARYHALTLRSPLDRHDTSKLFGWGGEDTNPPTPSGERPVSFPSGCVKIRHTNPPVWGFVCGVFGGAGLAYIGQSIEVMQKAH